MDNFDALVRLETGKDRGERSGWVLRAMEEFYQRHWPGNPQKPLLVSLPKPPVDNMKVSRRNAAIVFLRFRSHLSYRQIAQVVKEGYRAVRSVCKKQLNRGYEEFNGRRRPRSAAKKFKSSLELYRKRYRMYLRGEFKGPDEAFKF